MERTCLLNTAQHAHFLVCGKVIDRKMKRTRPPEAQQSTKGSKLWSREFSHESVERRCTHGFVSSTQNEKWPIRRVLSPSRSSKSYKPRVGAKFYTPRFPPDERSFKQTNKPGFGYQKMHRFTPRTYFPRRDLFHHKKHHVPPREWKTKRYEARESMDMISPPKQSSMARPFLPSSASNRDEDKRFTPPVCDRNPSRERDHKKTKSKEKETSRDRELAFTVSQTAARDQAIQQKKKEIDQVYYRECATFGVVVNKLIEKDPSLERPIQSSLQKNLRDIGIRCLKAMEKFIEDYDSGEMSHQSDSYTGMSAS